MSHKYISGNNLHQKILEGIEILADNVASTLGPRGRNVILHSKNKNTINRAKCTMRLMIEK